MTDETTTKLEPQHPRDGRLPDRIGGYKILEQIGEGGMGVVYLAEQEQPLRRRVALKVIKLGMDTRQVVARFEAERQALALMDHPHIASVFDAGVSADGRPYFVMEYVPGVPIADYCDRHRLSTRERVALFTDVCAAIQHAHHKGIIHRDLKPSNVLVALADGRPVPKVIDFGVAKATSQRLTERTLFTEHGLLIGTPEYMSPEQAEMTGLDVDTRTDIYSLGILLYELLVGALPFDAHRLRQAAYGEIQRIIREEEPTRPSTKLTALGDTAASVADRRHTNVPGLVRELKGDLDWITLRALEKDRTRRYPSASELAADLQRYLDLEPVSARPPSAAYRMTKFVRRHRLGVAAAAALVIAMAAGVVATTTMYFRAQREADRNRAVTDAFTAWVRDLDATSNGARDMEHFIPLARKAIALQRVALGNDRAGLYSYLQTCLFLSSMSHFAGPRDPAPNVPLAVRQFEAELSAELQTLAEGGKARSVFANVVESRTHATVMGYLWAKGVAISNGLVQLRNTRTSVVDATTRTDASGQFVFSGVFPGRYVIEYVGADYAAVAVGHEFDTTAGETVATFVRLQNPSPAAKAP